MKSIVSIMMVVFLLLGCSKNAASVSPQVEKEAEASPPKVTSFSEAKAIAMAKAYLEKEKLSWGKPSEIRPYELKGKVVQYTLFYETPTGEINKLGRRGLIATESGHVQRVERR